MKILFRLLVLFSFFFIGCNKNEQSGQKEGQNKDSIAVINPSEKETISLPNLLEDSLVNDTSFVILENWTMAFDYDMRYATDNNFTSKKIYNCDLCLVRKEVAKALIQANEEFMQLDYHIKFYDCYRPLDVQKILWEIYPVEGYVANPYTSGSNHNKGGAVDITLVDTDGNELPMGTGFDHFGKEAHHDYTELPDEVLENRMILKEIMEKYGFQAINTEWWHYNFKAGKSYPLSNFPTQCN